MNPSLMNPGFRPTLGPDPSKSAADANFTWFGPTDDGSVRFRYAVITEEGTSVSILPGEARFKKGLQALRWPAKEGGEAVTYLVSKTRPNRIDLERC
ncbi:MAG: hypothetical protein EXS14_04605 [Planctomycetes bacterium]|nr:hypothetical protein [Planctomycetota bacterium]